MRGQLWQECYCGDEPVCASCEKCKKHCRCGSKKNPKPYAVQYLTCPDCGWESEVMTSAPDAPTECPECDGELFDAESGLPFPGQDEVIEEEIVSNPSIGSRKYRIEIGYPRTDGIIATIIVSGNRWRRDPKNKIGELYTGTFVGTSWRKTKAIINEIVEALAYDPDQQKMSGFTDATEEQWYAEQIAISHWLLN